MNRSSIPGAVLAAVAAGFAAWAALLLASPGGPPPTEWAQLLAGLALLAWAMRSLWRGSGAEAVRWALVGVAGFGALVVVGLAADAASSRTWARLGWASMVAGYAGSLIAWASAPRPRRGWLLGGGVAGAVVIAAGLGITLNCDPSIQRSWCDPDFEREEAVLDLFAVAGRLEQSARVGGEGGPMEAVYRVDREAIEDLVSAPDGFAYRPGEPQGREQARGSYTAAAGRYRGCVVTVRVESRSGSLLATLSARCQEA